MNRCLFKTLGCKTNQYETQLLREQFLENGFSEVDDVNEADLLIINTCTVTSNSDKKSERLIRSLIRKNPKARVIVTGCCVDNPYSRVKDIKDVDLFIANKDKDKIISYIKDDYVNSIDTIKSFSIRDRAFVKIQDGCNNFCSYCIIPYTRGKPVSRDLKKIEEEVRNLTKSGYKEIVLTGIHIGLYGYDLGTNLLELIDRLISIRDLARLRLSSIDPNEIDRSLIERMKDSDKICRYLHISIQSGDDRILKRMRRRYKAKFLYKLLDYLKKEIPEIGISSDFMVGFPGESDKNFKNTLSLVKRYDFVKTHIFTYSDREKTESYNFKNKLSEDIKRERAEILKEESLKSSMRFKKNFLAKTLNVLVESRKDKQSYLLGGYTDNYIRTLILDANINHINSIIPARIIQIRENNTYSKIQN
ncbi:MAG: tRNA (N(6)-L-threonylcarbamoyladenosine(37)-C(2))-methylthiotransferase MtaB [Spirochaetes bacterium]|nr:MAG: tRNA (N(6)-L-threonylcarbamoyladenosine(37)-C(2))-methylthiotransferase MtaB [Spirochaetota bacterium]